jgi:hypothetical protein
MTTRDELIRLIDHLPDEEQARAVLEAALEPYVQAHLELRDQVHVRMVSAAAVEAQRDLRSGAIPMLPITEEETSQQESDVAPDEQTATVAAT